MTAPTATTDNAAPSADDAPAARRPTARAAIARVTTGRRAADGTVAPLALSSVVLNQTDVTDSGVGALFRACSRLSEVLCRRDDALAHE